jgi:hypothetical protein
VGKSEGNVVHAEQLLSRLLEDDGVQTQEVVEVGVRGLLLLARVVSFLLQSLPLHFERLFAVLVLLALLSASLKLPSAGNPSEVGSGLRALLSPALFVLIGFVDEVIDDVVEIPDLSEGPFLHLFQHFHLVR